MGQERKDQQLLEGGDCRSSSSGYVGAVSEIVAHKLMNNSLQLFSKARERYVSKHGVDGNGQPLGPGRWS